ncbi:hypothetical protein FPSE_12395 [Fusarium pseudograminearum CS3096]|uniref:Uncharacterized protein n=2 Tax=Fusarium pseudograminearum TaxID=101028 RepID=K3V6T4_FUSPC|nr:hypothetical protein FPSE_12395 [Fusarium pseudograminearum CS3096]EKJ67428.1 hypothetical protein FPSE_12395 [Fusarium pseudograminearum CS3096]CEG02888.1 unnamed protein product [Fusarium pseudograminearum CS3487]
MSSHSEEEAPVGFGDIFESLRELPDLPHGKPRALFGHIYMPQYRSEQNFLDQIRLSLPVDRRTTRFFIIGSDEDADEGEMSDSELAPVRMTIAEFLDVLKNNLRPPGSFMAWRPAPGPDAWQTKSVLPRRAVFLFQVDFFITAECALAVTLLMDWALTVSSHEGFSDIRFLTLSSHTDISFLEELLWKQGAVPLLTFPLSDENDPMLDNDISDARSLEQIAQELAGIVKKSDKTTRLILSFDETIQTHLQCLMGSDEMRSLVKVQSILPNWPQALMELRSIGDVANTELATLVTLCGQIPVRPKPIQGFQEIHVVLGHRDFYTPSWDNKTRQVLTYPRLTSKEYRELQLWWTYNPDASVTVYHCENTIDEFIAKGGDSPYIVEGAHMGAFVASAIDLERYSMSSKRIINSFIRNPLAAKDTIDMLTAQGLVSNNRLALEDQEAAVFRSVLRQVEYDYRLAMFLALDSEPIPRLVKVQVATVLALGSCHSLSKGDNTRPLALETIFKCCHGYGSSLAKQGTTWFNLGLAKYWLDRESRGVKTSSEIDGIVDLCAFSIDRLRTCTDDILQIFNSAGIEIDTKHNVSLERRELTSHEQWQIHCHLFRAYMHQVTFCRNPTSDPSERGPRIRLFRSNADCSLKKTFRAWQPDFKSLLGASDDNMVLGVSHNLVRLSKSHVEIEDWTMIPANVVAFWETETGLSLQATTASRVQHCPDNMDEITGTCSMSS